MSSAMNMLSSFTIFVLFVSIIISESRDFSDKNLIHSSNLKNDLVPVILNDDENIHIIKKRQDRYNNSEGIQVNGNIENSNATFNQIKNNIQESQKSLKYILESIQKEFEKYFTSFQNQLLDLYRRSKQLNLKASSKY
ncbi:Hypothetical protein SRAE_X000033700 [Strongyloides ratti]|uniref:Uncharacterized protein n=1 Tax=Strongyloides ratti TaxID=34506 RepID=A0A090LMC7_STRRB|nr:Hypothetical protein SRAE_X000033700 [Strongyloides ratti]CEF71010.1 Hypothetical protein SRAE_X000033700 [Strongyloides ratti]